MQVSVKKIDGLQRHLTVTPSVERVENEYNARLRSLANTTRINGFRPGKVPLRVIKQRFGEQVRQEVINEVVRQTMNEAIAQENIRLVTEPKLEYLNDTPDSFEYCVSFDVFPEIPTLQLDGIEIDKWVVEITEQDIDEMIDTLRKQRQTWDEVDRPAQQGDLLVIDYQAKLHNSGIEDESAQQQQLVLGEGRYQQEIESALLGAKIGDVVEVDLTLPANYPSINLAGKAVHFSVTVRKISGPQLPEVNEDFITAFGVSEGGIDVFRADIRDNLIVQRDKEIRNKLKERLFKLVIEKNPFNIPQSLIEQEAKILAENFTRNIVAQGVKLNKEFEPERFYDQARERVKIGFIVAQISYVQNFTPDPAKVKEMVDAIAISYDDPAAVVKWYYAEEGRLANVENAVLEEVVVDWLLGQVNVVEKTMDFNALFPERRGRVQG